MLFRRTAPLALALEQTKNLQSLAFRENGSPRGANAKPGVFSSEAAPKKCLIEDLSQVVRDTNKISKARQLRPYHFSRCYGAHP